MFPLQAAWLYYLENPALVLNGLALFFAVNGSWLWIATQLRSSLGRQRLATPPPSETDISQQREQRINRLFEVALPRDFHSGSELALRA